MKSVAAAYASGQIGRAPVIKQSRDNCRVVHRELIASITGSTNFTVPQQFALNPGIAATFPWLSAMAQCWQKYKFHKLRFCAYTRTGSNVPGSLMLVPDYDAADAAPATEQVASSYEDVAEDAPWKDICATLSPKAMSGPEHHFTRTTALAVNLDIKTYDVGNLFVCTVDGTAVNWSKLWVEYDVEFFVPQLPPGGEISPLGGTFTGANTQTAANPFGVAPVAGALANGILLSIASVLSFTTVGDYLVTVFCNGTVITGAVAGTANAGVASLSSSGIFNTAATSCMSFMAVRVSVPGATISFAGTATTITAATLYVAQAPAGSI